MAAGLPCRWPRLPALVAPRTPGRYPRGRPVDAFTADCVMAPSAARPARPPPPALRRPTPADCVVRSSASTPSTCSTATASCPTRRRPHPSLAGCHTPPPVVPSQPTLIRVGACLPPPHQGRGHSQDSPPPEIHPRAACSFPLVASPASCPPHGGCSASSPHGGFPGAPSSSQCRSLPALIADRWPSDRKVARWGRHVAVDWESGIGQLGRKMEEEGAHDSPTCRGTVNGEAD
jgi:hypothetical protein